MPTFSHDQLKDLVGRAMPLTERLGGAVVPVDEHGDAELIENRLARWQEAVTGGTAHQLFGVRLRLGQIDLSEIRPLFGTVCLTEDHHVPSWATLLNLALESCTRGRNVWDKSVLQDLTSETPQPFEELWLPLVEFAFEQVRQIAGQSVDLLGCSAQQSLQRQLLTSIVHLTAMACGKDFHLKLAKSEPISVLFPGGHNANTKRVRYNAYITNMLNGELLTFFIEYPVLGRLVATRLEKWIESTAEFCVRLKSDIPEITQTFFGGKRIGIVKDVSPHLSDPHNGGRAVIGLSFDVDVENCNLIYKPKDVGTEKAYSELLSWLNGCNLLESLRPIQVLDCETYGWVEFIKHKPCEDKEELKRYYRRAGMMLCLIRTLLGTDCHFENIIACGEHPVLVDSETLLHHNVCSPGQEEGKEIADVLAAKTLNNSVLRTGLLPVWQTGREGQSYDLSGLGAAEIQATGHCCRVFEGINTDGMLLAEKEVTIHPGNNSPTLHGRKRSPQSYVAEIVCGFDDMYTCLMTHREALSAKESPLAAFRDGIVRFVVRPTRVYGLLLRRVSSPEFLCDGVDRSIELEVLARSLISVDHEAPELHWPIYEAERQALERLDIPFFAARPDRTSLWADGQILIDDLFQESSYSQALNLMRQMGEADRDLQVSYIRATFHARYACSTKQPHQPTSLCEQIPADTTRLSRDKLVSAASNIAEEICNQAIHGSDGSVTWIGLRFDSATERHRLEPMGPTLYEGRSGVALFLATLDHVAGTSKYRSLILGASQRLRNELSGLKGKMLVRRFGLGGASGLGSTFYSYTRIGQYMEDGEILADVHRMTHLLTDDVISADDTLDVFGGSAGAILGLLTAYETLKSDRILERAIYCGRQLVAKQETKSDSSGGWSISGNRPLTGFSHGAAGIAYALLRLYVVSGENEFLECARRAIHFESRVYCQVQRNWPDLRGRCDENVASFKNAWCHGAAGIGLSRLGGIEALDTPEVREDIENALSTTITAPPEYDDLCCGNFGRIELMITAAHRLNRPELFVEARRWVSILMSRVERDGVWNLNSTITPYSLFKGTSGIGYEMLRLAEPNQVPCVLLWE